MNLATILNGDFTDEQLLNDSALFTKLNHYQWLEKIALTSKEKETLKDLINMTNNPTYPI